MIKNNLERSIKILLQQSTHELRNISKTPHLDAELLLAHVLKKNRVYLFSYPEKALNELQYQNWKKLLEKRQKKIPMAYLLGQKEFWGMMLEVNSHILIPRPETELLVELTVYKNHPSITDKEAINLLDLGTGSGAIALAIAKEKPDWQITAVDISIDALDIARRNAQKHNIHHIKFVQSDWFMNIQDRFNIIVSNPPYLDAEDIHLLTEDIQHEPRNALIANQKGMGDIEHIIIRARDYLKSNGCLLIEHGCEQGEIIRELFAQYNYHAIHTFRDFSQQERITHGMVYDDT